MADLALDEIRPDALGFPDGVHVGARLCIVPPEHISAVPIEECRDPVIRDAMYVDRSVLKLLHHRAELLEIMLGRILKIDRNMRVGHIEMADAPGFVR